MQDQPKRLKITSQDVSGTFPSRFLANIEKTDDCWNWTATKDAGGYGRICPGVPGRRPIAAHRASWVFYNGLIPNGMDVLHRCDNRACVNPEHLFLGTQKDNVQDMFKKGRDRRPKKLSDYEVMQILAVYATGAITQMSLANKFNVSQGHISDLVNGYRRPSITT